MLTLPLPVVVALALVYPARGLVRERPRAGTRSRCARDAWHGLEQLVVLLGLLFWPDGLDLLVIGSFVAYGVALLLALRPGAAELPLARLASDNVPRWLWRVVALCLLVSALGDGLIYLDQLMQSDSNDDPRDARLPAQ